jgi:translation elongation factor EF-4
MLHLTEWKQDLENITGAVPIVPIINKADLPSALSAADLSSAKEAMGCDFLFTSAKEGTGVQEAFERLGRQILGVQA